MMNGLSSIDKLKLLYYINKVYQQIMEVKNMNNDMKTTIAGIVATIGFILKIFKIDVPVEVTDGLIAIGIFVMAYFTNKKNKPKTDVGGSN